MSLPLRARVEALFEAAVERPAGERAAFVRAASAGDDAVADQVLALLAAHERADGVLEQDVRALLEDEAEPLPERLGAYRIVREIGRGGMGVVYEAERDDGQFRRRVAIKVLRAGNDRGLRQRVLAERQILAGLDHPHIARLLDGGVTADGRPYLVMEHVDGLPIDVYCDRMRLDVRERLRLFIDVARAVAFAHHNLVVHRDLKPSNILVSADGAVKLLDFGVAKMLNPALGGMVSPTLPDQLALTPEYASPEQLRGETLTTQSDVFALGALLYELLTGRRAFAAAGLAALIRAVCEEDVVPPSEVVLRDVVQPALDGSTRTVDAAAAAHARQVTPQRLARELRGDLDAIVLQALRREPRHRYGTAELLAADIESYLDGRPVAAHKRGRLYALGKLMRRHRMTAAALVLAVLSLVGGSVVSLWQAREARAQRDRAISAQAESDQVTEFLTALFEAGVPGGGVADAVTARDLIRRGGARIDELAAQPRVQSRMLAALGRAQEGLGDYDEAQRLTQRALAMQEGLRSPDLNDVARMLLQLGILQRRRAEYDSAEASFMRARSALERAARPSAIVKGSVLHQLASIAIYRGDLEEAERRAAEAFELQLRELGETHRLTVNALTYLGAVRWRRGKPEAEQLFRRAIELRPHAAGSTRADGMVEQLQLADLLNAQRRSPQEAESIFRRAIATMRIDEPDEFSHGVWGRNSLASILEARGDWRGAERLHREVLEMQRSVYGADHPSFAGALAGMGRHMLRAGRLDAAEQYFDQAAQIQRKTFGTQHPSYATVLTDRATLLAARGDLRAADSVAALVADMRFGSSAPSALPRVDHMRLRAEMRVRLGDYAAAEAILNDAFEIARTQLTEESRMMRDLHQAFADLYAAWGRPADAERHRVLTRTVSASAGMRTGG